MCHWYAQAVKISSYSFFFWLSVYSRKNDLSYQILANQRDCGKMFIFGPPVCRVSSAEACHILLCVWLLDRCYVAPWARHVYNTTNFLRGLVVPEKLGIYCLFLMIVQNSIILYGHYKHSKQCL